MRESVSNQGKTCASTTSPHTAGNIAAQDKNYKPDKTIHKHKNYIESQSLKANRADTVFINKGNACRLPTHWGPPSKDGHPGTLGGVDSGTYLFEAEATSCSPNLIIEDEGAVRTQDKTTQNQGNSKGLVFAGDYHAQSAKMAEELKKKCQIAKFEGTDTDGRKLGWPTLKKEGKPYYLEIYSDASVLFETTRHDITKTPPEENPACILDSDHTNWEWSTKLFPTFFIPDSDTIPGKEELIVEGTWAVEEWILQMLGWTGGGGPAEADGSQGNPAQDYADPHGGGYGRSYQGGHGDALDNYDANRPTKTDPKYSGNYRAPQMKNVPGTGGRVQMPPPRMVKQAIIWLLWWAFPPKIKVTATACGGTREAELRVYPRDKVNVAFGLDAANKLAQKAARGVGNRLKDGANNVRDKFERNRNQAAKQHGKAERQLAELQRVRDKTRGKGSQKRRRNAKKKIPGAEQKVAEKKAQLDKAEKHFQMVVSALGTVKNILTVANKVAERCGEPLQVRFLDGFELEFECYYLPTQDKRSWMKIRDYTTSTLGMVIMIELHAEPLLAVEYTRYVSILNLLVPFAGEWLGQLLRRFRVARIDLYVGIMVGCTLAVSGTKDEHDKPGQFGGSARIDFKLSIGLVAGVGGFDLIGFHADAPAEGKLQFNVFSEKMPTSIVSMQPSFSVWTFFRLVLAKDTWFEVEAWSASPKALSYTWEGKEYELLSQPR